MNKRIVIVLAWILTLLLIMACGISLGEEELSDEEKLQTAVAETVTANMPSPETPTQTVQVVPTVTSESPPSGPATQTPQPCNQALFVSETIEDGTDFDVGENFEKSWRLKNIGTCTWNTNYKIVFASGDKMGGPTSLNLTQSVDPGEQYDFIIDLKAPDSAGTYKGYWKVEDDSDNAFVHNLWVEIDAKAILGPPPIAKPDLVITNLNIDPAIPNADENTHVKVKAKNQGTMDSGGFRMQWYGLDTFTNPSCSWNISGGLAAGSSVTMECDFVFASWYPINKTTIALIDTNNSVDESNESNNTRTISPFGVNP